MQAGNRVQIHAGSGVLAADPLQSVNQPLFTASLAQNAGLGGRIKLTEALAAGRHARFQIQAISITSFDNLAWELWFWRNKLMQVGGTAGVGEDFAGFYSFLSTDGKQVAATGLWYYYKDGLNIPYWDTDAQGESAAVPLPAGVTPASAGAFLNTQVVNRSAGAKTVNAWFDLSVWAEPTLGW